VIGFVTQSRCYTLRALRGNINRLQLSGAGDLLDLGGPRPPIASIIVLAGGEESPAAEPQGVR